MIKFFNIKTGETRQAETEPQLAALYNSGNLHVNATRGQDFGWRLAPDTIKRIREIKSDDMLLTRIATTLSLPLDNITDTDILTWISREDARAEERKNQELEVDHTEEYEDEVRKVGANPSHYSPTVPVPERPKPAPVVESEPEAETLEELEAQTAKAAAITEPSDEDKAAQKEADDKELEAMLAEEQAEKDAEAKKKADAEKKAADKELAKNKPKDDNKSNS